MHTRCDAGVHLRRRQWRASVPPPFQRIKSLESGIAHRITDLELIKPLEELEQVPYLTEEYGNKVRQLNDLAVAARSAGFNIKKPDAHDPRQMKAYTLYQQILGESTALGGSLQEGYKAQELVAKDPAKYAKLLYNKEAGITRATQYSDLVGSDIDKGVVEFNKPSNSPISILVL